MSQKIPGRKLLYKRKEKDLKKAADEVIEVIEENYEIPVVIQRKKKVNTNSCFNFK